MSNVNSLDDYFANCCALIMCASTSISAHLLVKDKAGNINNVDNYRAITLSPVISKLFEKLLLSICSDCLESDPLQFGFKDKVC